jgi:class 3 adenylate cyclase
MAELPTGTVTFLFSDIEGSTRLLTELADGYERLLTQHRELLEACVDEADGHVVDTQGDAFFVAFGRAKDAVRAAVTGQRRLCEHAWPRESQPRVRMGLDTGEPSLLGTGFVGLPVHRAARICAAAHGGQVLLSRTTRGLVEDSLPPDIGLIDLGEHRLKDFDRTEAISQLVIDGLRTSFPPLRTSASDPRKAPPFAGQEDELAAAAQAALAPVPPRGGALRTRASALLTRRGSMPFARHSSAQGLERAGFQLHSMARTVVPREDLAAAVRRLGGAMVVAGRLARDADRLLAETDRRALGQRLAEYRDSAHIFQRHLRIADALARRLVAIDAVIELRRAFDAKARELEPRVAAVRERLFEVRIDPSGIDPLRHDVDAIREDVERVTKQLEAPYSRASAFMRVTTPQQGGEDFERSAAAEDRTQPPDRVAIPDYFGSHSNPMVPDHRRPGLDSDRR